MSLAADSWIITSSRRASSSRVLACRQHFALEFPARASSEHRFAKIGPMGEMLPGIASDWAAFYDHPRTPMMYGGDTVRRMLAGPSARTSIDVSWRSATHAVWRSGDELY